MRACAAANKQTLAWRRAHGMTLKKSVRRNLAAITWRVLIVFNNLSSVPSIITIHYHAARTANIDMAYRWHGSAHLSGGIERALRRSRISLYIFKRHAAPFALSCAPPLRIRIVSAAWRVKASLPLVLTASSLRCMRASRRRGVKISGGRGE